MPPKADVESARKDGKVPPRHGTLHRATRHIFQLRLEFLTYEQSQQRQYIRCAFTEETSTFWTFVGLLISELSSIAVAVFTGLWYGLSEGNMDNAPAAWYIAYSLLPLLLKLIALLLCVRREGLVFSPAPVRRTRESCLKEDSSSLEASTFVELFNVDVENIGFLLISTPEPAPLAFLQFTRHYGHPLRLGHLDRAREIASIATIFAFMFYFPAGLIALSWMNTVAQYLWLSQQLFCVIVMHIARLTGWEGCASILNRIAHCLYKDGIAILMVRVELRRLNFGKRPC